MSLPIAVNIIDGTITWPTSSPTVLTSAVCVELGGKDVDALVIATLGTGTVHLAVWLPTSSSTGYWSPLTSGGISVDESSGHRAEK